MTLDSLVHDSGRFFDLIILCDNAIVFVVIKIGINTKENGQVLPVERKGHIF